MNEEGIVLLENGVAMPLQGFGVWRIKDGEETRAAVEKALRVGYRSIDTAAVYGNERAVGKAVRESGIPREELFIATKVWNQDQGYEGTLAAFEESRKKLGLERLDLYLVHWPVPGRYRETWKAMEKLYREGLCRAIGVSNFQVHHLETLEASEIKPMVNQVELHPLLTQMPLRDHCSRKGIRMEAWSPLMQGNLNLKVLLELGEKHGKSPAQVVLRWHLQNGIVAIPKSTHKHRIEENFRIQDFHLEPEEMARIEDMNRDHRFGPDPENFSF
ncbi:aldo/keto reductase [Anaerotalea alkaliphila]|uniref:Aldo/keto reductase n=1 Tax=Anaerotalea alkaliphila TaxID=2662126 RepID=A0A7X5HT74_9FIRM|nr:aldo/keto reductase [Anaerotalea alkaliphila]NDL66222.1 aldo/keto reductase [Anaerotalea alkaliphila]